MDIVRFKNAIEKIEDKTKYANIISTVAETAEVAENLRRCYRHKTKIGNRYVSHLYGNHEHSVDYPINLECLKSFCDEAGILYEDYEDSKGTVEYSFEVEFQLTNSKDTAIRFVAEDTSNTHREGSIVEFTYTTGYDDRYVLVGEILESTKIRLPYEDWDEDGWNILVTDVIFSANDPELKPEVKNRIIKNNRLVGIPTINDIKLIKQGE